MRKAWPDVHIAACEIQERYADALDACADEVLCPQDILRTNTSKIVPFDLVLTNPPFNLAEDILTHCATMARGVAFLLRLNFAASVKRNDYMSILRPSVYTLPNRPSFRADGRTDATDYAWFAKNLRDRGDVWGEFHVLGKTPVEERKRPHAEMWLDEAPKQTEQERLINEAGIGCESRKLMRLRGIK